MSSDATNASSGFVMNRVVYTPPGAAVAMTMQPRFGHTRDFTAVLGTPVEQADYLVGLIFAGAFALGVFFAWSLVLLMFMCCGKNRVGFLSGRPFQLPAAIDHRDDPHPPIPGEGTKLMDEHDDEEDDDDGGEGGTRDNKDDAPPAPVAEYGVPKTVASFDNAVAAKAAENREETILRQRRHRNTRITFLLCGMVFIAFSFLLVIFGINRLETTMTSVGQVAGNVSELASGIVEARNNLVGESSEDFEQGVRETLITEFNNTATFCPADPTMENNPLVRNISAMSPEIVRLLSAGGDFLRSETQELVDTASRVEKGATQVQRAADTSQIPPGVLWVILVPFVVVPSFLMFGTILAMTNTSYCFLLCWNNWLMMPLFTLLVWASWIWSGVMAMMAGANSDFCLPGGHVDESPDTTVMAIVERAGYNQNTTVYEAMDWYTSQCMEGVTNPFFPFQEAVPKLENTSAVLDEFQSFIADPDVLGVLEQDCQRGYSVVLGGLQSLAVFLGALVEAVLAVLKLTRCDTVASLYTAAIYESTCTYSVTALTWIYASTLVLGFFGMLMITLRSSYKPTRVPAIASPTADGRNNAGAAESGFRDEPSGPSGPGDEVVQEVEANTAGGGSPVWATTGLAPQQGAPATTAQDNPSEEPDIDLGQPMGSPTPVVAPQSAADTPPLQVQVPVQQQQQQPPADAGPPLQVQVPVAASPAMQVQQPADGPPVQVQVPAGSAPPQQQQQQGQPAGEYVVPDNPFLDA